MAEFDYFTAVGTKPTIRSSDIFETDGSKPELLLDHLAKVHQPIGSDVHVVDAMFKEWCELLIDNRNIVIKGPLSKFRLLETFRKRYLESSCIFDLEPPNGKPRPSVTVVRMHGFEPISFEPFINSMFGIRENNQFKKDTVRSFAESARKAQMHYVFLVHSFDSLILANPKVCDIIHELYSIEPIFFHMLFSVDHINAGKILDKLKYNLVTYDVPYGESYFGEKTRVGGLIDDQDDDVTARKYKSQLFDGQLNLRTLQDFYQAFQHAVRFIMIYILEDFVKKSKINEQIESEKDPKKTKSTRRSTRHKTQPTDLSFNDLLSHCMAEFTVRGAATLRNHLGELKDHELIEYDETGNKIQCLVNLETCKKFLDYIQTQ